MIVNLVELKELFLKTIHVFRAKLHVCTHVKLKFLTRYTCMLNIAKTKDKMVLSLSYIMNEIFAFKIIFQIQKFEVYLGSDFD